MHGNFPLKPEYMLIAIILANILERYIFGLVLCMAWKKLSSPVSRAGNNLAALFPVFLEKAGGRGSQMDN